MVIGILGTTFSNQDISNMCIAYSLLFLLETIKNEKKEDWKYVFFEAVDNNQNFPEIEDTYLSSLDYMIVPIIRKGNLRISNQIKTHFQIKSTIPKCDIMIDISKSNMCTIISGKNNFLFWSKIKKYTLSQNIPLIMVPQTYGPFQNDEFLKIEKEILEKSSLVLCRDKKSKEYIQSFSHCDVKVTTDLSFDLPVYPVEELKNDSKRKIGIQISYSVYKESMEGNHKYKLYILSLIEYLERDYFYSIYLIPYNSQDMEIIKDIHRLYPFTNIIPYCKSPMHQNGYISQMDILFGTEIYASMAAFSKKVKTIPIHGSRESKRIFKNINYDIGILLLEESLETCLIKSLHYLNSDDIEPLESSFIEMQTKSKLNYQEIKAFIENSKRI